MATDPYLSPPYMQASKCSASFIKVSIRGSPSFRMIKMPPGSGSSYIFRGGLFIFGRLPRVPNFAEIYARVGRGLQPADFRDLIPPWGHTSPKQSAKADCAARTFPKQSAKADCAAGTSAKQSAKLCQSGTSPKQSAKADCVAGTSAKQSAKADCTTGTSPEQSAKLCQSGTSPKQSAKADCATGTSAKQSAKLCQSGTSPKQSGKVDCVTGTSAKQSAKLCRSGTSAKQSGKVFGLSAPGKKRFLITRGSAFPARALCRIRADFARKVCAFYRVAFFAPRSDECVAAEKRAAAAGGQSRRAREAHP